MTRVCLSALIAAVTLATPVGAQIGVRASTAAPSGAQNNDDAIIVQGRKKELAQALRQLIKPSGGAEQLARFEEDVCPLVAGMPRDWTAVMTRMIRANIVAVGGKVARNEAGRKCTVNAVVIFIDQPLELIKALAEAEPGFFTMTPRELAQFTAAPRAVSSWHVTDTRDRDGQELASMGSMTAGSAGGSVPTDAKIVRQASASRLYSTIREDMLTGFVVIDRQQTIGKSLRQLADLATMHLLLDVKVDAGTRDPGSILSLFEPRGGGALTPRGFSRFDKGALTGFYTQRENNRTAAQQRENIAEAIRRGAGDDKDKK
ncbi:hypothetical protein [Sphingomonas sp.]|uniref:hypothetical protein n=1 Tax=Sphingomonas sp. TaxID=28214 RepID=UPI00286A75C0|nr:hypothetical protein [Sphingomonas sp.]